MIRLLDAVSTPVFVLQVDDAGRPIYLVFNQASVDVSGISQAQVIGRTVAEIFPGRFGEVAYERHRQAVREPGRMTYEVTIPKPGGYRDIRTTLEPVFDGDGRLAYLVGTSADTANEKALREARATAQTITKEIEDFVSMAAHDLRTPLTHVQWLVEIIRRDFDGLDAEKLKTLELLESVATSAIDLVADILSYADARNARAEESRFEFASLCIDVMTMLDPFGRCQVAYDQVDLVADRTVVQIALRNLIDNALKHGERADVALQFRVAEGAAGFVEIAVADNGAGFKDPALAFLGGGALRSESGYGLMGLRRLIRTRGGEVTVGDAGIGAGAVVRFTVPGRIEGATAA
ncbi:MAG: PAS domain-containing sensor histidine kinase [Alphaproteobacteria bacterium]